MKRFLLFAICAIVALASCQKADETGIAPEQSSLKVTAVIADNATKVDYDVIDNTVTPKWVEGDEIFGYDGTDTFTFTVTAVDDSGVATFNAEDYTPTDGTTLHAVYYPGKDADDFTSGELAVDLTSQNGVLDGTAPAIMCATATVQGDEVNFKFLNQTAIIGVKKFQVNPGETISTFKASGLVATGTIKLVDGALALVPDTTPADMTITCNYAADATTGMYENPVYFIAMPTADAKIILNADGTSLNYTVKSIVAGDITAGNYYYMSKKLSGDPVARYSNDGGSTWTYTESLADAISGIAAATAKEDGMVELLKDHAMTAQIVFEGLKFTLDGNGHTITVPSLEEATSIWPKSSSDVTFKNVTIKGPGTATANRAIAYQQSTVTLNDCIIKDFNNSNNGGALWGNGTLILTGNSKIENCHSTGSIGGGAIFAENATVSIGDDVTISGCTATKGAGAIYLYGTAKLTMGSATITNCQATAGAGGAFWFAGSGKSTITGATIANCTATGGNAGCLIINGSGTVTMTDCTISSCTCPTTDCYGGAIRAIQGTLNLNGGEIKNCVAKYGGGVSTSGGTVNLSGVSISGCAVNNSGSGGTFYLTGGTVNVKDNSTINGTNAYVSTAGTLNITNSTYKYTGTGYALYVYGKTGSANGTINVNGGSVIKATNGGTGAYAFYGTLNITENSQIIANGSYGIYLYTGGKVTCTNAIVLNSGTGHAFYAGTGNTASSMTVNSGYYATNGTNISGIYDSTASKRITVKGGYFNKNTVKGTNFGTGITVKSITPVKKTIDGTEYTFGYQAKS